MHKNTLKILCFLNLFATFAYFAQAQSINIGDFYYRDFLDFGQNKGAFKESASSANANGGSANGSGSSKKGLEFLGKDSSKLSVPQIPNFSASSNYGSLTSVGRGFLATANHVSSPQNADGLLDWGVTKYSIAKQSVESSDGEIGSTSKLYGWDTKFLRLSKYVVEGQAQMLDIDNTKTSNSNEAKNLENFKKQLDDFRDSSGDIYLYQAGSGIVTLRGTSNMQSFNTNSSGEMRGGGFGTFGGADYYNAGIGFYYKPMSGFYNQITSGDSGSGIYVYDDKNSKWILLGVVSRDNGAISVASNKDFRDYQRHFEQEIDLQGKVWTLKGNDLEDNSLSSKALQGNKDIIFGSGGTIQVEKDIDRTQSGYAGGFVFRDSANEITYKFENKNGENHYFKGSGLDIGKNVRVEWALRNASGDSLHKIGKGELIIKTNYTPTKEGENLGTLKIGEGKVSLDTSKKAYENIYITSGRGELSLIHAEALGATKNSNNVSTTQAGAKSYTLSQDKNTNMGFYFGTGGGKLDLLGNSLVLNTIVANDSDAIITNSSTKATVEIEGFGYDTNGNKTATKENTIIHASVGKADSTSQANQTNIDIVYSGDRNATNARNGLPRLAIGKSSNYDLAGDSIPSLRVSEANAAIQKNNKNGVASLIFDGNINTQGKMNINNGNIALQGHATTHATISDDKIRNQVANAENGTQKGMLSYMDLSKPTHLEQPDWDNRSFTFGSGINLANSNLTLGRNASLESSIALDSSSSVVFGGGVLHFVDNLDSKNVIGSGFTYQQRVESGSIGTEQEKIANHTISYRGKISANGGTINSSIFDFNASLDLKNGAKLRAEYLTLRDNDSIVLASGASATIQNLILKNVSDISQIFQNSSSGEKLKVEKSFHFYDVSSFDLSKLDLAYIDKSANYDIVGVKSSITGTNSALSANIWLEGGNLSLKSLTLKKIDNSTVKNTIYLQGAENSVAQLKINDSLKVGDTNGLIKADLSLRDNSILDTPMIEFNSVENGTFLLDSKAEIKNTANTNKTELKGIDSTIDIYIGGSKEFDINASSTSDKQTIITLFDFVPEDKSTQTTPNPTFSGKITASGTSKVESLLDNITASVDLSGSANLVAENITLDSTHNLISLSDSARLSADTITAKSLSNLTLQQNGGVANVENFIFDSSTTNLVGNLIGKNIKLKSSTLKTTDLTFSHNATLSLDNDSKLEVKNLNVESTNLTLDFANSKASAENLANITLSNGANLAINSWDFGNATNFKSDEKSRIDFANLAYTQSPNTAPKNIQSNTTISGTLLLSKVGANLNSNDRFETLTFEKQNLTLGENSSISVAFDDSVKKGASNITLDKYFTLISAGSVSDNRADKRIDFRFAQGVVPLFVVSKFYENKLLVKFLESNPRSFAELSKHISSAHTKTLLALTEHNPNDENIDKAASTEEYSALESTLASYEEAMREIATQSSGENLSAILQNNDLSIKMRILQVRSKTQNLATQKPQNLQKLRLVSALSYSSTNSTKAAAYTNPNATQSDYDDISLLLGVAPKSLPTLSLNPYRNSAWASALGGYAGTLGLNLAFYGSSVGYDRIVGSTLLGVMASFGGSHLLQKKSKQSGIIAGGGAYLHTHFGKSEFQSSLSFAYSSLESSAFGDNIKSSVFGGFWSNYYKYNIALIDGNILKPLGTIGLGISKASDWRGAEFRGGGFGDVFAHIGAGLEYVIFGKNGFYTLGLVGVQKLHSQAKAQVSFANASTMLDFVVNNNAFEVQGYFIGSHTIKERLNIEYAIHINGDTRGYYGTKGSVGFRYAF